MNSIERLLLENKAWAQEMKDNDPDFFKRLAEGQQPDFLWIGCADSRVPPNTITNAAPGQMFVHRNVANLVVNTDLNLMSVLQYAVEYLEVKHIILCGHTGCGGVKAALGNKSMGSLNKWVREVKNVYYNHRAEVDAEANLHEKVNKLVKLNVIEQSKNLARTTIVQKAWHKKQPLKIHGWIFDLENGLLDQVIHLNQIEEVDPIFRLEGFDTE